MRVMTGVHKVDFWTEASEGWHTGNAGTATRADNTCGIFAVR